MDKRFSTKKIQRTVTANGMMSDGDVLLGVP